ncbi:hypothetical protein NLX86_24685 [Streptomyces sp. A3M-1-3]|uniref:hypothetical protein n=1 Tax=Streptomyces sp. A3M-1-3 TaxID=2962044 RepID=UPI0020B7CEE4|nr:hypothetical protein [Streptomyces sp. A3M-1-3]MCP3821172.1 hypothetical protein [Streptomyces sp. A3M-1-3]
MCQIAVMIECSTATRALSGPRRAVSRWTTVYVYDDWGNCTSQTTWPCTVCGQ